jgi:nicotinate-nucleotide adenylyltransferase
MGGCFDPPHLGHRACAGAALEKGGLDRLIFVPAFRRPGKHAPYAEPKIRLRMVRAAVRGDSRLSVSDLEIRRKGTSYTIDTLRLLRKKHPGTSLVLVMGADSLHDFHTWKSPGEILKTASLLVLNRNLRTKCPVPLPQHRAIRMPVMEISSTDIRQKLRNGESISGLVPPAVEQIIHRYKLYRNP